MSLSNKWKKYIALGGILFLFPLVFLIFFGKLGNHQFKTLKYYGPGAKTAVDSSSYQLPEFVFTNQENQAYPSDSLKGNVWIAAFYSLNDPHLDKFTERLLNINFRYRDEEDVRIVVFSTDCDHDTPSLVQEYTKQLNRYNIRKDKWIFLTGQQSAMQSYIRNGFLIDDLSAEARFKLIDAEGHIRGQYGNTEYHIKDAMEDIALLKKEMDINDYNERKAKENSNH